MSTQIQLRRDTAANWTSTNPVLAQAEAGYETDTGKLKLGDGTTAWASLAYQAAANIVDGTIVNTDINASAGIVDTKLATIATAGKVSNSATTATDANTASAIVARDASGNFTAGTITAALTGAASSNVLKAGDTMTGALVHPLGAAATPSLTFTGDLDTGIYSPGADQVAVATNGTGRVFIDSSGRVGVASSASFSTFSYASADRTPRFQVVGTSLDEAALAITRTNSAPSIFLGNGSSGSNTDASATLGRFVFAGFQTDKHYSGAEIQALAAGTPSQTSMPASLIFNTTPAASTTPVERLRITSAGLVGIGTTSPAATLHIVSADNATTSLLSGATNAIRVTGNNTGIGGGTIEGVNAAASAFAPLFVGGSDLRFGISGTERARIDSSGRLLVGASAVISNIGSVKSEFFGGNVVLDSFLANAFSYGFSFVKSRGTATLGTLLSNGDQLGPIQWYGDDGSGTAKVAASIDSFVDGTPGANDMPGRLVFSTTADGASSPTERMRINSAGALGVGGANFGTTGQALISNGSSAVPTWQDLNTAVFGWDHDNDTYGLYLPGTSISTGSLSGTINIDVQSRMRRCVINNSGVVQYYLDADASTNKAGDWLRIVETESLATAYTGAPAAEATNSLLRVGVPAWAAGTFTRGQRVTNGGYLWECVAASSTATPAAGAVASVLDGTDGQVVVEIPAFSVRYGFINGVHTREVRLGCNDGLIAQGFRPHPAFIKTDGTYKSAFYWGAYQAYSDGTNLASVSGQTNTRSLTRGTFRTRAALRGTGWHVQSYLELAAIQTLLVTEYRDYNSQKVLGNGSMEGATYGVATGLSNSRGNRSGNVYTGGGSSSDFMSYRGIENLYGRAWTWADGINVYERVVYLTNNQSVFADDTSVGYSFYAQVPSSSGSYQKELFPLADVFLPSVVGASSTTYLADALYTSTGWRVALVGGGSGGGSVVGAFCLLLGDASGSTYADFGARSAYAAN